MNTTFSMLEHAGTTLDEFPLSVPPAITLISVSAVPAGPPRMDTIGSFEWLDEVELIEACRSGSGQAWQELLRRYGPLGYAYLYHQFRSLSGEVEDIFQVSLEKLSTHIQSYQGTGAFRSWFFAILRNTALKQYYKDRHHLQDISINTDEETHAELELIEQHDGIAALENRMLVEWLLDQVSIRERAAIILRYYRDCSYEEIAQALGMRSEAVGVLLLRTLRKMRALLQKDAQSSSKENNPGRLRGLTSQAAFCQEPFSQNGSL